MSDVVNSILLNADYLILMFFRMSALIVSSPIFGRVNIPLRIRITLAAALTYLFFIAFPPIAEIQYTSLLGFALICISEVLIGIALAFVTNVFFAIPFIAGHEIDMEIGFGIVNVYDIQNNTQIPMTGNILNLIMLVLFFVMDWHHKLIEVMHITLRELPIGNLTFSPAIGIVAAEVFALSFTLGLMIAMPITASSLVLQFCFGALMRSVPQLHMFVIGIPLKMFIGFFMIWMTLPMFANFSDRIFTEMFIGVEQMFSTFLAGT